MKATETKCPGMEDIQLLRMAELVRVIPLSRSSIYALSKRGMFPLPIKLSERSSAWRLADIRAWLEERAKLSAQ